MAVRLVSLAAAGLRLTTSTDSNVAMLCSVSTRSSSAGSVPNWSIGESIGHQMVRWKLGRAEARMITHATYVLSFAESRICLNHRESF